MIQQDKIEHWAFGFMFTLFYIIHPSLIYSGIVFAVGKEVYDKYYGTGFDIKDIMATLAGVWTGFMFLAVAI